MWNCVYTTSYNTYKFIISATGRSRDQDKQKQIVVMYICTTPFFWESGISVNEAIEAGLPILSLDS